SKPAMMRSSRGVRRPAPMGAISTPSASSSSSSSRSAMAAIPLRLRRLGLSAIARESGHALGHALLPSVGRADVRHAAAFVLELQGAPGKFTGLVFGDLDLFAGDARLNPAQ